MGIISRVPPSIVQIERNANYSSPSQSKPVRTSSPPRSERSAASPPSTPKPPIREQVSSAQRAEDRADRAAEQVARNPSLPPQHYIDAALLRIDADQAWDAVEESVAERYAEVDESLDSAAGDAPAQPGPFLEQTPGTAPSADMIEQTTAELLDEAPADGRYRDIVLQGQADAAQAAIDEIVGGADVVGASDAASPLDIFQLPNVTGPSPDNVAAVTELTALAVSSQARISDDPQAVLEAAGEQIDTSSAYAAAMEQGVAQAQTQLESGNVEGWQAFATGGPSAAAETVRAQIADADTSAERDQILIDSMPLLRQIQTDSAAYGRQADHNGSNLQPHFDDVVNDLSWIATSVSGTTVGDQFVDDAAGWIVDSIAEQNNVTRYDEAFGLAVENGAGAHLGVAVIEQLRLRGDARSIDQAGDILQNVVAGQEASVDRLVGYQETVDGLNQDLARALPYLALLESDDAQQAALADYQNEHASDYGARDSRLVRTLRDGDLIHQLLEEDGTALSATSRGEDAVEDGRSLIADTMSDDTVLRALSESDRTADIVLGALDDSDSVFSASSLTELADNAADPDAFRTAWLDITFDSVAAGAASAVENDNPDRAAELFTELETYADFATSDPQERGEFLDLIRGLGEIAAAPDSNAALEAAELFGNALDVSDYAINDPLSSQRFQRAALAVGIASVGTRAPEVLANGDLTSRLGLSIDVGNVALGVYEWRTGDSGLGVRGFGKLLGAAELVVNIASFPSNGDGAEKALAGVSIAGQVGALFSVPGAGWVAGTAGLLLLGYQALDNTQDNAIARDLLVAGGFDPDVAQALTEYDVNGYSGAMAIREGARLRLGLTPEQAQTDAGREAITGYLQQLSPHQAGALAEDVQGLRPMAVEPQRPGESDADFAQRRAAQDPDGDGIRFITGQPITSDNPSADARAIASFVRETAPYYPHAEIPKITTLAGLEAWFGAYNATNDERFPDPSDDVLANVEAAQADD